MLTIDKKGSVLTNRAYSTLIFIICALTTISICWNRDVNHDIAWYLVACAKWLNGARLYIDIVEVNPPLAFYVTAPATAIYLMTGISQENAFYFIFAIILALSLSTCWKFIVENRLVERINASVFIFLALTILLCSGLQDMGQRDHLFIIFTLPWLLGQLVPQQSRTRGSQVGMALFASLGVCLKPYFILLPALVTIWLVVRERSWRPVLTPSNLVLLAVGLVYVGYVAVVHPAYLQQVVPAARLVYGSYTFGAAVILEQLPIPMIILATLAATAVSRRQPAVELFAAAAFAGLISYLLQWTGFRYHILPFEIFSALGLAWLIAENWRVDRRSLAPILLLCVVGGINLSQGFYASPAADALAGRVRGHSSLTTFSSNLVPGPPVALKSGAAWASRYPALWLIPGAINRLDSLDCSQDAALCHNLKNILEGSRADIMTDLVQQMPKIIIFDNGSPFFKERLSPFDWRNFMSAQPEFPAFMNDYALDVELGQFEVWIRKK